MSSIVGVLVVVLVVMGISTVIGLTVFHSVKAYDWILESRKLRESIKKIVTLNSDHVVVLTVPITAEADDVQEFCSEAVELIRKVAGVGDGPVVPEFPVIVCKDGYNVDGINEEYMADYGWYRRSETKEQERVRRSLEKMAGQTQDQKGQKWSRNLKERLKLSR